MTRERRTPGPERANDLVAETASPREKPHANELGDGSQRFGAVRRTERAALSRLSRELE
jgi:hypothetical protein